MRQYILKEHPDDPDACVAVNVSFDLQDLSQYITNKMQEEGRLARNEIAHVFEIISADEVSGLEVGAAIGVLVDEPSLN